MLTTISTVWRDRRDELESSAEKLTEHLRQLAEQKPVDAAGRGAADDRRDRVAHLQLRLGVGRLGKRSEVPARADARVPLPAGRSPNPGEDARRDGRRRHVRPRRRRVPPLLDRPALARAALREDALRQRAAGGLLPARLPAPRQAAVPRGGRGDARVPAARARPAGRRRSPRRRTPIPTARRASASRSRARTGFPTRCCTPSRAAASSSAASSTQTKRAELFALRELAPEACARRQGRRLVERARARRVRRVRSGARPRRLGRDGAAARRVPARADVERRRPSPPHLARGDREGVGLPRGLRRRRERPARAARGDGRASLASGGKPARPARGRSLLRRRVRRLLPDAPSTASS